MTTNVPQLTFTDTGIDAPAESDILSGALDDIDNAFGGGLNKNLETPQGQLASSFSAIIADKNDCMIDLANNVDPDYASGFFQDAIAKIYFLERKPATSSVASCEIVGLAGTVVNQGFLVRDANNYIWQLASTVTIGTGGTATGEFICMTLGPISAAAGTISTIYQSVIGVDRISNPYAATPGQDVESRQDFELRRKNSVALNAHGAPQAVRSAVFNLGGVQDVFVRDNVKGEPIFYGATNYEIGPHSIYVAVVGGDNDQIADVIWRKTGNGCNYSGNTAVTVYDASYTVPQPEYEITFNRPSQTQVYFNIQAEDNSNFSNSLVSTIKTVITNAFYGLDGGNRERIGGHIHAAKYVAAILAVLPDIHLIKVEIGFSQDDYTNYLVLGIDQYPAVSDDNISVNAAAL